MGTMARRIAVGLVVIAALGTAAALVIGAQTPEGVIGPDTRIQPNGRLLNPVGKLTDLGNLPTGGALTIDGRFAWTLSAGRGANDVRIVRVKKQGKKKPGKVVQTIPMPGVSGGIAMSPDGKDRLRLRHPGGRQEVEHGRRRRPRSGRRRDPRLQVEQAERQGDPRRGDRRPGAPGDAAAAELPAHQHGRPVLAAGPGGVPGRHQAARGPEPRERGGDRRHRQPLGLLRADRPLPLRRRDHPRRQARPDLEPDGRDRLRDRSRLGLGRQVDHGRSAPLPPRGDRDRPEAPAGLRRGHQPGSDRGHQHR